MKKFILRPDIDMVEGIIVTKETNLSFKNEMIEQEIKDLKIETISTQKGITNNNAWEAKSYAKLFLNEGDILLYDADRGYYVTSDIYCTITDGINDLLALKDFDKEE